MKTCPRCGARYSDDLSFCLQDGSRLAAVPTADISGNPTEQFRQETTNRSDVSNFETLPSQPVQAAPPTKRYQFSAVDPSSRMGCIVTVGVLGLVVVSGFALVASYYNFSGRSEVAMNDPKSANIANPPVVYNSAAPTNTAATSNSTANTPVTNRTETANVANVANAAPTPAATRKPAATPAPVQTEKSPAATPTPEPKPSQMPTIWPSDRKVIAGGNLNGRAISLPQPPFPPAARAAGAGGIVIVRVLIDEGGRVVAAEAIRGHPLLRAAAVSAARGARFSPTTIGGEPVRVRGVITYNFIY